MARIERVELRLVDIPPKVKRTDAIQSFVSQETPIVTITDADGAVGDRLQLHDRHRRLVGDAAARRSSRAAPDRPATPSASRRSGASSNSRPTRPPSARFPRWRSPRSTRRYGTCAAASAALPLWIVAGGAADRRPLYTTEGGWLHIDDERAGRGRAAPRGRRAFAARRSRSAARMSRRTTRASPRCARRSAPAYEIMTDANQGFALDEAIRRAGRLRRPRSRLDRGAAAGRRSRRPRPAVAIDLDADRGRRVALFDPPFPRIHGQGRLQHRPGRRRAHRRDHAVAEGRARGRGLRHAGLPAFPDGAARQPRLRGSERQICRIHSRSSTISRRRGLRIENGMARRADDAGHRRRMGSRRGEGEERSPEFTTTISIGRKAMQRMGMVIGVRPEQIDEYKRLHAAVWPERAGEDLRLQHPELFDLPARAGKPAVRLLGISRRRTSGRRRRQDGGRPAHAGMVGESACRCQQPLRQPQARRVVGADGAEVFLPIARLRRADGLSILGVSLRQILARAEPAARRSSPSAPARSSPTRIFPPIARRAFRSPGVFDLDADARAGGRRHVRRRPGVRLARRGAGGRRASSSIWRRRLPPTPACCARLPRRRGVLIQKPMGADHAEATRNPARSAAQRKLTAAVNFQLRFAPMMLAVRDALDKGLIGRARRRRGRIWRSTRHGRCSRSSRVCRASRSPSIRSTISTSSAASSAIPRACTPRRSAIRRPTWRRPALRRSSTMATTCAARFRSITTTPSAANSRSPNFASRARRARPTPSSACCSTIPAASPTLMDQGEGRARLGGGPPARRLVPRRLHRPHGQPATLRRRRGRGARRQRRGRLDRRWRWWRRPIDRAPAPRRRCGDAPEGTRRLGGRASRAPGGRDVVPPGDFLGGSQA